MRLGQYAALIGAFQVSVVLSGPTSSPKEIHPKGLLSDARKGVKRPALERPTINDEKGKAKLLDSAFQLDQYLSSTKSKVEGQASHSRTQITNPLRHDDIAGSETDKNAASLLQAGKGKASADQNLYRPHQLSSTLSMPNPSISSKGKGKLMDVSDQSDQPYKQAKRLKTVASSSSQRYHLGLDSSSLPMMQKGPSIQIASVDETDHIKAKKLEQEIIDKRKKLSKALLQKKHKTIFEHHWKDNKLHTGLDATILAEKVFGLRAYGIHSHTIGQHASAIVRAKGDRDYEASYLIRMKRLSSGFSTVMANFKKDPELSRLEPEILTKMAIDEAYKYGKLNRAVRRKDPTIPVAHKKEAVKNIETVGKVAVDYLTAKGLDFYTMPLSQIEVETRGLGIPEMLPNQFSRALNRFIQHQRGERDVDMAKLKLARKDFVNQSHNKKQQQQQQRE